MQNTSEANLILNLVQKIFVLKEKNIAKEEELSIAVITPYRRQCALLKRVLVSTGAAVCSVGTIDEFQGQEYDVVIMSCVKASNSENVFFVQQILINSFNRLDSY